MTSNQPTHRPQTAHRSAAWRAVQRTVHAVKHLQDEQALMWESFTRASRFPANQADGDQAGVAGQPGQVLGDRQPAGVR